VEINTRERYQEPYNRYVEAQIDVPERTVTSKERTRTYDREGRPIGGQAPAFEATLDATEQQFRQGTSPIVTAENRYGTSARDYYEDSGSRFGGPTSDFAPQQSQVRIEEKTSRTTVDPARYPQQKVQVERTSRTTVDPPRRHPQKDIRVEKTTRTTVDPPKRDMGYYDEDGQYHSFRRGVARVAERIAHPIHGPSLRHHHHGHGGEEREEVIVKDTEVQITAPRESHVSSTRTYKPEPTRAMPPNTITIPCHHIRIGDLLILQGRPCQVIRITTSSQTGQHRYLGVDLFTKQLHEESSFISNPSPSVVVQNMLGPVFKQYRVLDIRDDGRVVAMTETGDVKQGLQVIDQSNLLDRLSESFDNGRGSVRVLVINDAGQELAVDYKVVHGSRL